MKKPLGQYHVDTKWLANVDGNLDLFRTQAGKTYRDDADALEWIDVAAAFARNALLGFAAGEMTFRETIQAVNTMSGCPPAARITLLGIAADRALNTTPRRLGESKPLIPRWLRASFGELIERGMLEENLTQVQAADRVLSLIDRWGFTDVLKRRPTVETLQEWHRDWKRGTGATLKPGRPRKPA